MIKKFTDVLRQQIRDDMNHHADAVSTGACRSFEEYQKLCGVIQGLAVAERYLLDLAQQVEKDDE
jgi:hypothetical protein